MNRWGFFRFSSFFTLTIITLRFLPSVSRSFLFENEQMKIRKAEQGKGCLRDEIRELAIIASAFEFIIISFAFVENITDTK